MNDERRDSFSVDDILNEYYAADASNVPRAVSPIEELQRRPATASPTPVQRAPRAQAAPRMQPAAPSAYAATSASSQRAAAKKTTQKSRRKSVHRDDYDSYYEYDDGEEPRRKRGGGGLVAVMLLFLLAVGSVGAFGAYEFLCKTVFPGVTLGGFDVGGMSLNEAANLISGSFDTQNVGSLTLKMDDYTFELPISEVVSGVDATESARAAFLYGREGDPIARAKEILTARFSGADIEMTMDVDRRAISAWLDEIAGSNFDGPVQPSYEIVEDQLVVNLGSPGVSFADREGVEQQLIDKLKIMDLSPLFVEASVQEQDPIDLKAIQEEITAEPKNATLDTSDGVTVTPSVDGVKMDLNAAQSIIGDATTGEFKIPLELTPAEVSADQLQEMLFRDTLAATKTELNPGQKSRTHNVELACNYINGTILNPGDEFSYNNVVGQRTAARGFQEAGIFVAGRLEEGLGGGVCQPSSTLYMAVLRADLKVTERSNHGMTVSYTPLGEDATVSWGTLDFKFVNDTEYPIKILASREGSYCKMTILGTKTTDKTVEIKTNTLSTTKWTTVRQLDTSLKPGTEKVDQSGSTGYRTETFKVITENGQTTTVKANTSTYRKRDKLILYNDASSASSTEQPAESNSSSNSESVLPADPTAPAESNATAEPSTSETSTASSASEQQPAPAESNPEPAAPAETTEPPVSTEPVQTTPDPSVDPETPMFGPGQPIV